MNNKKQTAANNDFLRSVKNMYNKHIYKVVIEAVNEEGEEAGKKRLKECLFGTEKER